MVQQQATRKLIQRQTINRLMHNFLGKPGWNAPIYSNDSKGIDPNWPAWH